MRKLLVTGTSGFIGRNIVESRLSERWDVYAPRRAELDLLDEEAVTAYLAKGRFDAIIHAAVKPTHRAAKDRDQTLNSNLRMFLNIAKNRDYFGKLIVTGSGSIYDSRYYRAKMSEADFGSHIPIDDLGLYKYVVGRMIEQESRFLELRIFGIYGKYEDYSIRFISNIICKALFDLPLTMNQDRYFDYIYVNDIIPVLEHFLESNSAARAYNVTPDNSERLASIAEMILEETGKDLPIVVRTPGMGPEYSGDNSLLRAEMPNFALTNLRIGIRELIAYYRENIDMLDSSVLLADR